MHRRHVALLTRSQALVLPFGSARSHGSRNGEGDSSDGPDRRRVWPGSRSPRPSAASTSRCRRRRGRPSCCPACCGTPARGSPTSGQRTAAGCCAAPTGALLDAQPEPGDAGRARRRGAASRAAPRRVAGTRLRRRRRVIASGARRHGRAWGGPATRTLRLASPAVAVPARAGRDRAVRARVAPARRRRARFRAGCSPSAAWCSRGPWPTRRRGAVVAGHRVAVRVRRRVRPWSAGDAALTDFGAAHLLLGVGRVAAGRHRFVPRRRATAHSSSSRARSPPCCGIAGALLAFAGVSNAGVAAVLVSLVLAIVPTLPLLAIRLGKLPMPVLPTSAEDMLKDEPTPPRAAVYAAVIRSDELLTGMLLGAALVSVVGELVLSGPPTPTASVLVALVAGASLLRGTALPDRAPAGAAADDRPRRRDRARARLDAAGRRDAARRGGAAVAGRRGSAWPPPASRTAAARRRRTSAGSPTSSTWCSSSRCCRSPVEFRPVRLRAGPGRLARRGSTRPWRARLNRTLDHAEGAVGEDCRRLSPTPLTSFAIASSSVSATK